MCGKMDLSLGRMIDKMEKRCRYRDWNPYILWAFAFTLPISHGLSEIFLFTAIFFSVMQAFRGGHQFDWRTKITVPVALYAMAALAGIIFSSRFGVSIGKVHRLFFLLLIFMIPGTFAARSINDLFGLIFSYVAGASTNAVYDIIRISNHSIKGGNIYDAGSMITPQFYMVALFMLVAFAKIHSSKGRNVKGPFALCIALLLLNLTGLIMHFKRGVWLATAIAGGGLLIVRRRMMYVALLLLCGLALLLFPQIRSRLGQLPEEFSLSQGGRWTLWTQVAPAIIAENPTGIGWHAMKHEDLAARADYVQPDLDHLHNNILQVTAELGIIGGLVWVVWMIWTLGYMVVVCRRRKSSGRDSADMAQVVTMGFVALLLDGMVENNFDSGGIMLLYCFLIGIIIALDRLGPACADECSDNAV